MADDFGEKTEAPTQRRRDEFREEGDLARSTDLTSAAVLLGGILLLGAFGPHVLHSLRILLVSNLQPDPHADPLRTGDLGALWNQALALGARAIAPIVLGLLAVGLAAAVLQVGFLITAKPLIPKLSKVSPLNGFKRLFSLRGLVKLAMDLLKVAGVLAVAWLTIRNDLPALLILMHLEAAQLLAAAATLVWALALKLAVLLFLLGLLDYAYQRWQKEQEMRMSKHEVKEDLKRMEGDPLTRQRRARVARQLALQRINHDVPRADVVVSNPTHFAVALRYDSATMTAPRVVAKGADFLALRIRQVAAAHGVPIVERPPLARALYRAVEPGQEVPPQYYAAVAEILAYVYRLSGRKSA